MKKKTDASVDPTAAANDASSKPVDPKLVAAKALHAKLGWPMERARSYVARLPADRLQLIVQCGSLARHADEALKIALDAFVDETNYPDEKRRKEIIVNGKVAAGEMKPEERDTELREFDERYTATMAEYKQRLAAIGSLNGSA